EAMWDAITFAGINHILFDSSLKTSDYSEDHVFTIDNIKEKLYSPSWINANRLSFVTSTIQKYGKLRINNGLIINSKLSNHKGDLARTNFCIAVLDRNAHHRNTPVILEEKEFFGE
ncbi:2876_t:CDS:2, partial [Gigaspora rosea]